MRLCQASCAARVTAGVLCARVRTTTCRGRGVPEIAAGPIRRRPESSRHLIPPHAAAVGALPVHRWVVPTLISRTVPYMEPVGWVVDTVGSRHEDPATERKREIESQPPGDDASIPGPGRSPQAEERGATSEAHSSGPGEASSHNSVDDLLRRIAREVRARQARSDDNARRGTPHDSLRRDQRRHDTSNSSSGERQLHQRREYRHPSREDSTRSSRWGKIPERGASAQPRGGGAGKREASVRTATAEEVSPAEANPFVESMWEDASCRQVLQAMFFAQDSAVPTGSTEEYKELEGQENKR